MRLIRFASADSSEARAGILSNNRVEELTGSWTEILRGKHERSGRGFPLADIRLLPPIESGRIFCAAVNYAAHRDEMGRATVEKPTLFLRTAASVVGPDEPVIKPAATQSFDFEGELALVIGKPGRRIARERALEHVAGWTLFMDGSVRDWQRHTSQFTPGKNFDRSGALGPYLMTPDELGDYKARTLTTRLNGTVVQETAVDLMLFDVEALIEYVSAFTELLPGDVIATGTCGGVGEKRVPPLFMFAGDKVEVEVTGVGLLASEIADEPLVA